MKKKLSVGFFTAALAAFILLACAYHFTYEKALERAGDASLAARTEEGGDTKESPSVETEGSAVKEDTYCLLEENGYVVVYLGDRETVYDYTSIEVASLPAGLQHEIKNGKYVGSTQMLYSFLENYSS
ncbi:BofC C-terminal domain-containing protein [Mordavella massiliensis]|uniref:BofC C-terminal domain-containing protein n=1 Tax=Mordavella massiliensis TaxID=1871024 RepID=A0A938XFH5_9CLOT|nr:BofC C-terminal domain-containing protein [Mordavella massiliensis]MBM6949037.1 BofC C-terminal domain-containing protein [Mordavella massiliensis]